MKVQLKERDYSFENGKEVLWYAEHYQTKRIFFTSPLSPVPHGYVRHCTKNPKEMDRLFNRMHEQERAKNEQVIEGILTRGREHYDRLRSALRTRLQSAGVSDAEKNIIRASLKLMDERDSKMQQNTVYGVSAMQESEAPLEPTRTRIM
ncbi:MAG TPA: hypothetical protein VN666_21840 [Nitrospira sp.]|nr:hypothetical protein [Nitrospira sp.]